MQDLSAVAGFFSPHVDRALRELESFVGDRSTLNVELLESLRAGLNREYYELTYRTLIGNYKLIEHLVSFSSYTSALSEDDTRQYIMSRYPVLMRWMDEFAARWSLNTADILNHFTEDRVSIIDTLIESDQDSQLISIDFGLGDCHRGGKSVAVLRLASGAKIIYKPRSLEIDKHFRNIVHFIAKKSDLDLITPRHISGGGYGWVEYIEYRSCDDQCAVETYFRRLGALLAVLYVLEASDFHYENIIASGAHPMLVDLEAVCHPRSPILGTETNEDGDNTILRTGLLPRRITIGDSSGSDISGMTDVEGQQGVIERLFLAQNDEGEFSFKRERGILRGAQNVPMLGSRKVVTDPALAVHFKSGFSIAYDVMAKHTVELNALVDQFALAEVRVIFRATLAYTHLLDEARHPAILLSENAVAKHFRSLEKMSLDYPVLGELVADEVEALQQRDVPVFSCLAGSRDLIINGKKTKSNFFLGSGLDAVKRRIAALTNDDRDRQLWIIDKALHISADSSVAPPDVKAAPVSDTSVIQNDDLSMRLMNQARLIGDLVRDQIYHDETQANWLVVKPTNKENTTASVWNATYDLYGGMPGEILFFDQLAALDGNRDCRILADKSLTHLERQVRRSFQSIKPVGLLGGWGSLIALATSLGLSRKDDIFIKKALKIIKYIQEAELISVDVNYSLTKGAAGLIYACANLCDITRSEEALALADRAYQHLMANRHNVETGYGWRISSERPLSGLAHGASGFAVAFAKLFEVSGDEKYRQACLESLRFERTLFIDDENNWLDQRDIILHHGGPRCSMSWAHGAPGIGIARLAILKAGIDSPEIVDDLNVAVRATLDTGKTSSFSIISGNFGRLELPILFAERYGNAFWPETEALIRETLKRLELHTQKLQTDGRPPLGMFSGITGVGYQCLRFACSQQVPSLAGLDQYPSRSQAPLKPQCRDRSSQYSDN